MNVTDGVEQRFTIVVSVEIEDDVNHIAELYHRNLRPVSGDVKGSCDTFGETQHPDVPVVVIWIFDNDACRLVEHE